MVSSMVVRYSVMYCSVVSCIVVCNLLSVFIVIAIHISDHCKLDDLMDQWVGGSLIG